MFQTLNSQTPVMMFGILMVIVVLGCINCESGDCSGDCSGDYSGDPWWDVPSSCGMSCGISLNPVSILLP